MGERLAHAVAADHAGQLLLFVGLIFLTNQSILVAQTYTFSRSAGIDTLSPQRKLHVEGDFLVSGPESLIYLDRFGGPSSGLAYFSSKNPEPPYIQWMHHKDGGTPVRYGYIQSGDFGTTREIGVIAQEVETIFPELVTQWVEENYRAVDYGWLTAVLMEAIKALKAQQDAQQQYIIGLEARVAALEQAKGRNGGPMQLSFLTAVRLLFAAVVGRLSNSWRRSKK